MHLYGIDNQSGSIDHFQKIWTTNNAKNYTSVNEAYEGGRKEGEFEPCSSSSEQSTLIVFSFTGFTLKTTSMALAT